MPGEKGFRYVYAPAHITTILEKIQNTGRPDKLTMPYIKKTWLLKNDQYSAVLPLLRDMDFINASGTPLDAYKKYQNPTLATNVLAEGIKKAYPDLFKAYPNACSISKAVIEGYFKEHTGKTGSVLEKIISTFYALCNLAKFPEAKEIIKEAEEQKIEERVKEERGISKIQLEPNIQVNIGINIAADTPDDKIKVIFENMKKYLLTRDKE